MARRLFFNVAAVGTGVGCLGTLLGLNSMGQSIMNESPSRARAHKHEHNTDTGGTTTLSPPQAQVVSDSSLAALKGGTLLSPSPPQPQVVSDSSLAKLKGGSTLQKPQAQVVSDSSLAALKAKGIVIIDNVLTLKELQDCRAEIAGMIDSDRKDLFGVNDNDDETVRRDKVIWVYEDSGSSAHKTRIGPAVLRAIRILRAVPAELLDRASSPTAYKEASFGVPLSNQLA
jgi:hypothetical protein